MNDILLVSEAFVRDVLTINENVSGKILLPAIREAQEFGLRPILGQALLDKIKTLIDADAIGVAGNESYRAVVEHCSYFLAYQSAAELGKKLTYKFGNFGVAKANDENLQVASWEEISKMEDYYQGKADAYALDLQNWLLDNVTDLPELTFSQRNKMRSNLYSAASCGIWLGGPRGKQLPGSREPRRRR